MTASTPEPVIDFTAHIYPEDAFPESPLQRKSRDFIGPIITDPETYVETYDAAGIDRAVLSQPAYMGHGDADAVATANDALLDIVGTYDRFYGLAAIPVAAGGAAAAEEFERALENGYNGGALETKSEGIELTDESLEPVFDVAERWGAPVLVHPKLQESLHPDVLDDAYALNAVFGREAALAESLWKVVHDGVLDRHPDLDLVYHHLGGNVASSLGRIQLHLEEGRLGYEILAPLREENDVRLKLFDEFKAQLEERIYVDTCGFLSHTVPLRAALETLPTSQILFGTDSPYEPHSVEDYRSYMADVREFTSDTDAARIASGNALDLMVNVDE